MAASLTSLPRRYRCTTGSPTIRILPEDTTGLFKYMEPVYLNSGKVQRIVGISTTVVSSTATGGIIGFALKDASGTVDTDVPVLVTDDRIEVSYPLQAATAITTSSITHVGLACCLTHTATAGQYAAEPSITSNASLEITEIDAEYTTATNGWVWARITEASRCIA